MGLTAGGRAYYLDISRRLLKHFRGGHPQLDFALSVSVNWDQFHPERCMDLGAMDVLDAHVWFSHFDENMDMGDAYDLNLEQRINRHLQVKGLWKEHREKLIGRISASIRQYGELGRASGAIVGNTEGWGAVGWDDLDGMDWQFIKEAAEICVELSLQQGYKFICTSNFTHPHFKRLWADVGWHKAITAKIRDG